MALVLNVERDLRRDFVAELMSELESADKEFSNGEYFTLAEFDKHMKENYGVPTFDN